VRGKRDGDKGGGDVGDLERKVEPRLGGSQRAVDGGGLPGEGDAAFAPG
jgi:hypothetical protein